MDGNKVFWPVAAVLVGTLALMVNLGYLPRMTLSYWPVLLVIWGLIKISSIEAVAKKSSRRK